MPKEATAAIYCRVSTVEQADGISLEMQEQRCRDWARARQWTVADVYRDVESGRTAHRREFIRLRRRLHTYGALVVWRLDRATRSLADLCQLLERCEEAQTAFVSVTEGFDASEAFGKATASILGVVGELESDTIGARVAAAKRQLLTSGIVPWKLKYGYRRNGGREIDVHTDEAAIVRRIFSERVTGRMLQQIAQDLNRQGLLRRGNLWTPTKISGILYDRAYIGELVVGYKKRAGKRWQKQARHERTVLRDLVPAIVTREAWIMARGRSTKGRRPTSPALFRGLVECASCQEGYYIHTRQRKGRSIIDYRCSGRQRGHGCAASQVTGAVLRQRFAQALRAALNGRRHLWIDPPAADEAEGNLADARAAYDRAQHAYTAGVLELDILEDAKRQLDAAEAIVANPNRLAASPEQVAVAVRQCSKGLALDENGDVIAANEHLRRVLSKIVVNGNTRQVRIVLRHRDKASEW